MVSFITRDLLLLAGLCSQVSGAMHESHHDGYTTPHFPNMAPKLANFAFKLYRELARQSNNKNIIFTAVSIAIAFAMPSLGAKGDTRTEIMKALGYNSRKALNADIHGGVHHLLDTSIRQDGDFHAEEKTTVKVPMINRLAVLNLYRDHLLSSGVLLQHFKGRIATSLFLPEYTAPSRGPVPGAGKAMPTPVTGERRRKRNVNLNLPRLSISGTYDLQTLLGKLGITKVFSNGADLSGIAEGVPLKLSKAIHKTVLSVNENETGQAEVTLLEEGSWSKHLTINFNMPFIIITKDVNTNIPLFMGKRIVFRVNKDGGTGCALHTDAGRYIVGPEIHPSSTRQVVYPAMW
ncbi:alpha-1-antitrypsin-like [Vicugna pacos]|uniref:Alpha-1-antitrypsin-like n=1 Tax=Vicugna pacos TaxID=30538 RepID=A0ABM5DGH1_VICPA